jgi:hypothetical protein
MLKPRLLVLAVLFSSCQPKAPLTSEGKEFQECNLFGNTSHSKHALGVKPGEFVLTGDDGPGTRTLELAKFLAQENVPMTFFFRGDHAEQNLDAVKEIANLKLPNGEFAHRLGNHTYGHLGMLGGLNENKIKEDKVRGGDCRRIVDAKGNLTEAAQPNVDNWDKNKPFPCGAHGYSDILRTDGILRPVSNNKVLFPDLSNEKTMFFRAPFGQYVATNASDYWKTIQVTRLLNNDPKIAKGFIGPFNWDIGGKSIEEGKGKYGADWSCWNNKLTIQKCQELYLNEIVEQESGIILLHDLDIDPKSMHTVDMLMGNKEKGIPSLIQLIKQKKTKAGIPFHFVAIDSHPEALKKYMEPACQMPR